MEVVEDDRRHDFKQKRSKRLKSGTLVALTPAEDRFQHQCIVALSGARPLALLEGLSVQGGMDTIAAPMFEVFFCRPEDIPVDPQLEWMASKQEVYTKKCVDG